MNVNKLHQKLPTNWIDREKLRDKGQFWTPNWVAEAMISYVLDGTDIVFDPATGNGSFFEAFLKQNRSNKIKFYGTDIDENLLKNEIYNNEFCVVEKRDFIKNPPNRKFMSIIANPPYIRHHRIDIETKTFLKNLCLKITGFKIDGRAGYHIYFLLQALNHLEKYGKLAFIMPADTCEGVFADKLWHWITEHYFLEGVIAFDEKATPFPRVDTNALIFLIRNEKPQNHLYWIKVNESNTDELLQLIKSNFIFNHITSCIVITKRDLKEALKTGLSRPEQNTKEYKYHLFDFAKVMRGIATGENKFFLLTKAQIEEHGIPDKYIKLVIGKTRYVNGDILTTKDMEQLERESKPIFLLSIVDSYDELPNQLINYIKKGVELNIHNNSLIKQRNPWFKMEKREIPDILFAYLGRKNIRFIKNEARVIPLTGFLCVYPKYNDKIFIDNLWKALNHPETIKNLKLVGKSYGSGAVKVEPRKLEALPIPESVVGQYKLNGQHQDREIQQFLNYKSE